MDRRAAGALLALAACIASSAAAPTAGNHTALDLYEGAPEGCYYNFQHYGEGDRIMTNEPCLNCTCHNRMLMCYLRVCPFTKPIGQDCTVEKRADQCCPIITCPDVPVDLLTSTSTSSPAEYGATGLGKLDKYGCSISGKYFPEGSKVPPTPNKPCEHCYCIRNMTTCVMQECTLHVDGCTPIYHKDVCCPIRYSCDHPEDEVLLLDDMSTTVRPTPGFLLTTTTVSPVTQMTQDCVHNDQIIADGASITTEKACEHCYCMKGDIVCVVQECGAPMENEGKNCTSLPPRDGQCCPDTYICEGDELSTEIPTDSTTDSILEKITTLSPPRRSGDEGSGYRNEPNEATDAEISLTESPSEGSGEEPELMKPIDEYEALTPKQPSESEKVTTNVAESVTTKGPVYKEIESSTTEIDKNLIPDSFEKETTKPQLSIPDMPIEDTSDVNTELNLPDEHVTIAGTSIPASFDQFTTELIESLNTVPDISPDKEPDLHHEHNTAIPELETTEPSLPQKNVEIKTTTSTKEQDVTLNPISESTFESEYLTPNPEKSDENVQNLTEKPLVTEEIPQKGWYPERDGSTVKEEIQTILPDIPETVTVSDISSEKDIDKPDSFTPSTTNTPVQETEKLTTELNNAQNTVIVAEEDNQYPHITTPQQTEKATVSYLDDIVTEKSTKLDVLEPEEHIPTVESILIESETTSEPDKGLNTIPSDTDEHSHPETSSLDVTTSSTIKSTDSPIAIDRTNLPKTEESPTSTPILESHVTKADLYTVTTEPSFRKEDESNISTEKTKEEFGSTTIKSEFVDEGLIPTSGQDDKLSTGSNIPFTDEEITTIIPEFNKEPEVAVTVKQPATDSLPESLGSSETLPGKIAETTDETESHLPPSTEKTIISTVLPEIHEEPSRIPGEGDCLLNGVTYRNNSVVPSTNNCLTGCKCVSSIVKCDPIICSPPPDYMSNCQSIFDSPDSCCPTYICDHPRETIPPQSDNQMSGTESPVVSPTIECRGDQCELSVPTKPTEPSELCTSDSCVSVPADETGTKECGPDGCADSVKESVPLQPSTEQSECTDGKCPPVEECVNGKCQLSPTHSLPPTNTCEGDDCKIPVAELPVSQLCENGQDCKKVEVPVTQTVTNVDCGNNDCESGSISPSQDKQPEPCNEKGGCTPEEIAPLDCTNEESCRRKDFSVAEELPPKCEGSDCVQNTDKSVTQNIDKYGTASPISGETPLNDVTEPTLTDSSILEQEKMRTTPIIQSITEHVPTEHTIHETVDMSEKTPETPENITNQPSLVEKEGTKSPGVIEGYTDTPVSIEDTFTTKSDDITEEAKTPTLIDHQGTEMPDVGISKPSPDLEPETTVPVENDQEKADKQPFDENVTQIPIVMDEYTHKSTDETVTKTTDVIKTEESGIKVPDVTEEYFDNLTKTPDITKEPIEPTKVDGDNNEPDVVDDFTEKPLTTEEFTKAPGHVTKYTDIPHSTEDQETKIPDIEDKAPVTTVEEEGTKVPKVTEEYSNIPTEIPVIVKEHPDEVNKIEESSTKTPDIIEQDTEKQIFATEKDTKIPEDEKVPVDKLTEVDEEGTKVPSVTDDYYNKPTETPNIIKDSTQKVTSVDELHTESSGDVDEQSYVPVFVAEDGTEAPDYGLQHSNISTASEELGSKIPDSIEKEPKDELIPTKDESTKPPEITEEYTDEPTRLINIPDEPIKIPADETAEPTIASDIVKEQTDEPAGVQDSGTTLTSIKEEHTQLPVFITEESTKTPYYGGDTPLLEEDDSNKKEPFLPAEELPEKSTDMKETPAFIEKEVTSEPAITGEDGTENPKAVEDSSTTKTMLTEEPAVVEMQGTGDLHTATETSTDDKPSINKEASDKPEVVMEHYTPASVETDKTSKPDILDEQTITSETPQRIPQTSDDNQSGTTEPQIYFTESDKEVKLHESSINEHPETVDKDIEKVTQVSTYESPTTESEGLHMESHLKESETNKPELISPQDTATSSDANDLESVTKEPYHHSSTEVLNEVTTEFTTKLEKTTELPVAVSISENTLPPLQEEGPITPYQEHVTNEHEATEKPEMIITTESVEKITKTTEHVISNEPEEGYTGIPEQVPSVTKSPAEVIIEPQEGELPESPDLSQTNLADVETTTKVFEDNMKSTAPEYESTSKLPETDRVTDVANLETQKPKLPEQHEYNLESMTTKTPVIIEKTDQPEIYTPEQEEMITTTIDSTGTLAPTKGSTEIDDSLIPNEEQPTTGYNVETTERVSESSESLSSKTTKVPEEPYTNLHEGFTDAPIFDASTTSKSPVLVQETPDSDKPISVEPSRRKEKPELEKTTPQVTELPVVLVTESDDKLTGPVGDSIVPEEKTTKTPYYLHSDVSTILPETYVTEAPVTTRIPEPNEPALPEQTKSTESSDTDAKVTDDQETDIKLNVPEVTDAQKTTVVPESTDTLGPQTEAEEQKSSTESPVSLQVHTDLPLTQATPEASLSLVTEHQPDSVTVEKQDHTEAVLQDSHTVAPEQIAEKEDVATSLHETTTVKQLDITLPTEKTSAEVELIETTPYLTELEEHTHKITDDSSTMLSVDEKVPISESGEGSSTPFQEEQHTPAPDVVTPLTSEEEHTVKVEVDHSTVSSSTEDYAHKIPEDTSVVSPSIEEVTTEKEPQDSNKITEKAPEKDLEIATKQSEILSGSSEETSTIPGVMSYQTTLSEPKDTDTDIKPLREQTTEAPLNVEDSGVTQKDITTSKQSQDFESTTPVTFTDTEKAPISETDINVPTKEEASHNHLPDETDKTTASEDELTSSTPKITTVKQEELLTPSSEDKYNSPEDKPASEAFLPNSTTEVPKPSPEIEPTEEIPAPEEDGLSSSGGYGEPDYTEEDQAFGPGTCRYGGKVYVSAQQIPRDDPCDFCFCFRSDIICLQQSCPPPIHGCHEEPIQGFCCPRYECPVSMATTVNVTTTTTTTTTTLPPHFPTHGYKGAAQRRGCQIKGHTYKVGEVVRSSSGPCLHCTCGGDGQMKCDPKACTPEPMLRQMIAAAVSAKRRR